MYDRHRLGTHKPSYRILTRKLDAEVHVRTAELEGKTAELLQKAAMLDLANDAILVRDAAGKISYWNEGAERLYGWTSAEVLGRSTSEFIATEFPVLLSEILATERWEGELHQRKRDGSRIIVGSRWTTLRDKNGSPFAWLEINTDITARKRAEESAKKLSSRILRMQDEEHRRIAKGLHDSLGQYLAALKMNLDRFRAQTPEEIAVLNESSEMVEKCLTETRTISHLLHPPLLDESGFGSAARWYVQGFARRRGITLNLELPERLMRLHADAEIALFRAVQECLTNIHKHAESSIVDILLTQNATSVCMEIRDNGIGVPIERLRRLQEGTGEMGVGIAGMRERFGQLGGSLEIRSDGTGTAIRVILPLSVAQIENGRLLPRFQSGHADYLRDAALRQASELRESFPDSSETRMVAMCAEQLESLAHELALLSTMSRDNEEFPRVRTRVEAIKGAMSCDCPLADESSRGRRAHLTASGCKPHWPAIHEKMLPGSCTSCVYCVPLPPSALRVVHHKLVIPASHLSSNPQIGHPSHRKGIKIFYQRHEDKTDGTPKNAEQACRVGKRMGERRTLFQCSYRILASWRGGIR